MIGDDYGHLNAPPSVTDIDIKNKVSDTNYIYVLFMILILLYGLLVMYRVVYTNVYRMVRQLSLSPVVLRGPR